MEPILVPAWPSVLRAGLPFLWGGQPCVVVRVTPNGVVLQLEDTVIGRDAQFVHFGGHLRLDLRDPAVRDAVVRAMWRKLRPTEPELLTAPTWACSYGPGMVPEDDMDEPGACWYLGPDGAALTFVDAEDGPVDDDTVFVDGLEDIARACAPDRDLLALAACAAAVLEGA